MVPMRKDSSIAPSMKHYLAKRHITLYLMFGDFRGHYVHNIKVDGNLFGITANLWAFLHCASTELANLDGISIWVYALCINQASDKEKGRQVPLMGKIYADAEMVIAWLSGGCRQAHSKSPAVRSPLAFDGPAALAGAIKHDTTLSAHRSTPNLLVESFAQLLDHVVWSRLWIVQEILLAKRVEILCEGQCILWSDLARLIDQVFYCDKPQSKVATYIRSSTNQVNLNNIEQSWPVFDFFKSTPGPQLKPDLITAMKQYSNHDCSALHDRVFAMLAISSNGDSLKITYSESLTSLFARILAHDFNTRQEMHDEESCKVLARLLGLNLDRGLMLDRLLLGRSGPRERLKDLDAVLSSESDLQAGSRIRLCKECVDWPLHDTMVWLPGTRVIFKLQSDTTSIFNGLFSYDVRVYELSEDYTVLHRNVWYGHLDTSRVNFLKGTICDQSSWYTALKVAMPRRGRDSVCPGPYIRSNQLVGQTLCASKDTVHREYVVLSTQ